VATDVAFTLTLTITNWGTSAVTGIKAPALTQTGTTSVTRLTGPTPATLSVAGGMSGTITGTYKSGANGTVVLSATATGTDATSGLTDSVSFSSNPITITP